LLAHLGVSPLRVVPHYYGDLQDLPSFPTRRSSDLTKIHVGLSGTPIPLAFAIENAAGDLDRRQKDALPHHFHTPNLINTNDEIRSEEHTSELQSRENLVCRLLLQKKKRPSSATNTA